MTTKTAGSQLDKSETNFLEKSASYLNEDELKRVKDALEFAKSAHKGVLRHSGEPFVIHPLKTALILAQIKAGPVSLCAALLHDVLEDTETTSADIKKRFGAEVLTLIESVTKLGTIRIKKGWFPFSKIEERELPEFERQVETLRKMLVAMARDLRVVLIKFADRIHNLETLNHLRADKIERIAGEALEIYAPIAERLGMGDWKARLEDLAFPYLYPKEYKKLVENYRPKIKEKEKYLVSVKQKVAKILKENTVVADVHFRIKHWYSLYRKIKKSDGDSSKVYDLIAIRIVVGSVEDCYKILGLIHREWRPLVGRIKDYVALPKPNGYRSIHTTVICDGGQIVEFQIRTREMHREAEFGVAAHWLYSEKKSSILPDKEKLKWLIDFSKNHKNISSRELADSVLADMFQDRIFVYTPTGDAKDLAAGATPVDFAYSVHTELGNHCAGAKINGKIAQISTKLQNGDFVEIIESKNAKPRADWLGFVKTHLARSQIRHATSKTKLGTFGRIKKRMRF